LLAGLADGCPALFFNAFDVFRDASTVASVVRFADLFTFFHDNLLPAAWIADARRIDTGRLKSAKVFRPPYHRSILITVTAGGNLVGQAIR
jgi:hypothetical protein